MRALVINQYGPPDVFNMQDIDQPIPGPHEVLIDVKCSSINPVDWKIRNGDLMIIIPKLFPRVLGVDCSGIVSQVGAAVKAFKPGDAVFGMSSPLRTRYGANAQFSIAEKDSLAVKPEALSFEDAAGIPVAGLSAYKAFVNFMQLQPGQKVLINGGSGGVGTYGVQMAKALGAKVTATCGADNMEFVKTLGADEVIDYKTQDARQLSELFDGILDAAGKWDFSSVKRILTKNGVYVSTLPSRDVFVGMLISRILPGKKAFIVSAGSGNKVSQELTAIADMITSGKVRTIIAETISLEEVPKAHETSQQGHARGKTIVRIG